MICLLLTWGADVNAPDACGWKALTGAARNGNLDAARALIANGAELNVHHQGGRSAVMRAGDWQRWELLRRLAPDYAYGRSGVRNYLQRQANGAGEPLRGSAP